MTHHDQYTSDDSTTVKWNDTSWPVHMWWQHDCTAKWHIMTSTHMMTARLYSEMTHHDQYTCDDSTTVQRNDTSWPVHIWWQHDCKAKWHIMTSTQVMTTQETLNQCLPNLSVCATPSLIEIYHGTAPLFLSWQYRGGGEKRGRCRP
jgi:hypothetical protein